MMRPASARTSGVATSRVAGRGLAAGGAQLRAAQATHSPAAGTPAIIMRPESHTHAHPQPAMQASKQASSVAQAAVATLASAVAALMFSAGPAMAHIPLDSQELKEKYYRVPPEANIGAPGAWQRCLGVCLPGWLLTG